MSRPLARAALCLLAAAATAAAGCIDPRTDAVAAPHTAAPSPALAALPVGAAPGDSAVAAAGSRLTASVASSVTPAASAQAPDLSPAVVPAALPATMLRPRPGKVTIAFAGDVNFVNASARALTGSGVKGVASMMKGADLVVGNLETAITTRGTAQVKAFTFRSPASSLTQVKRMGFDVVGVANNHAGDYGTIGMTDTIAAGKKYKLPMIGIGRNETQAYAPYVTTINNRRIAVLDATQVLDANLVTSWTAGPRKAGIAWVGDGARLVRAVKNLRPRVDTLVVMLHWGIELQQCPSAAQVWIRDQLVAAGADVVLGTHAHLLLGSGFTGRTYVHYGLGNFVFSAHSARTDRTGVLKLTFSGKKISARWVPARIVSGVPVQLTGAAGRSAVRDQAALRSCTDLKATQG